MVTGESLAHELISWSRAILQAAEHEDAERRGLQDLGWVQGVLELRARVEGTSAGVRSVHEGRLDVRETKLLEFRRARFELRRCLLRTGARPAYGPGVVPTSTVALWMQCS